jgi:hypothetical protein
MVTFRCLLLGVVVVACGGTTIGTTGAPPPGSTTIPPGGTSYDGTGFVVHEWGTNTIVVGTDGSVQIGLHHEEEDLPDFVADRMKATKLGAPVEVKMETPVTYFYSPSPLTAEVSVHFPQGIFTQWYPHAQSFYPLLLPATPNSGTGIADPILDPTYPFQSSVCSSGYGQAKNGLLDWGNVIVGARSDSPSLPEASLDKYSWAFARQVASNPVSVITTDNSGTNAEPEKFLFYRGVGNNTLPVTITASSDDGGVTMTYPPQSITTASIPSVFVLRVGASSGAFIVHPEGIAPGASLDEIAPPLDASALPIDAFSDALAKAVVVELDKTGLFHDESVAMVHTWQRQWFRTPGVRVLYLVPQAFTDAQIPITITPPPDQITRVMMIRVEVLTRVLEQDDVKSLACVGAPNDACAAHFTALGRFAEPRLRRAMSIAGSWSSGADALLQSIQGPQIAALTGE